MQKILKSLWPALVILVMLFSMTGCVEHRYYHRYHHHSREYYDRHHTPPPPGINFEIRN